MWRWHPFLATAAADPRSPGWSSPHPEERQAVAKAVAKRRNEFFCGRTLARRVIVELGGSPGSLPPRADRRLPWPSGVVGSLAHCDDACVVVASHAERAQAIGVDLEPAGRMEPELAAAILDPRERAEFERCSDPLRWLEAVFVCKEAFYKAQYTLTETFLDFGDARTTFDAAWPFSQSEFRIEAPRTERGEWCGRVARIGGHWLALVVVPPG
ncbi:MAG TPA: 4'-phosphopantetheinyl transferase superfamily protein [Myxococcales bacterium LLY-WYZ-16_1]|nr:4'-phosphopantetheinyl transferase superfamily protein [Myxococcales bacterium LLY-WYZ-16_1]